ncbi:MAG: TadE family protein [Planctomycetaceae bacterium]|nr:TadE family protein [Planctomycetaceae bacterium]
MKLSPMLKTPRQHASAAFKSRQQPLDVVRRRGNASAADHKSSDASRRRRGVLTIEMLLVLPILLFVLLAVFEFSILLFARSSVVQACRVAARQASLAAVDQNQVEAIVQLVLSPNLQTNMVVNYVPASRSGEVTTVAIQVPMSNAAPDLLWPIGFSLQGRYLTQETCVVKE